ncbi:MAG: helix-turn-helix domain-containing protein [Candidatus Limnocylindrales bacterium]
MDPVRFGLAIRALRRRHGWTQAELATKAGISQSAVSRIERGEGDHLTPRLLARVAEELGARIRVSITAHGEDLDRLLDAGHAELVEVVAKLLRDRGWVVVPEATFSVYGERGSIDILAFHPATGALLVVEVKSTVPDVQATLAGIDRKERLAAGIAKGRGWNARSVSRWLVVTDDSTARRRIDQHAATFDAALPARTLELRRWAAAPTGRIAGILFVAQTTQSSSRHRVRHRGPSQHSGG